MPLKSNSVVVATSYFCPAIVTKPREPYSGSLLELDELLELLELDEELLELLELDEELLELLELDEELLDVDEYELDVVEDELLDESPSGFSSPQPVRSAAAAKIPTKILPFS